MKKKSLLYLVIVIFSSVWLIAPNAFAKIEWEMEKGISINEKPIDVAVSKDGLSTYILCSDKILLYSTRSKKITESIPIEGKYSGIELTPNGEKLLLTDTENKQISIISILKIYDIKIGQSPIIGNKDAPVNLFVFMDYQ